jgi:hypothetical protein
MMVRMETNRKATVLFHANNCTCRLSPSSSVDPTCERFTDELCYYACVYQSVKKNSVYQNSMVIEQTAKRVFAVAYENESLGLGLLGQETTPDKGFLASDKYESVSGTNPYFMYQKCHFLVSYALMACSWVYSANCGFGRRGSTETCTQ